MTDPSPFSSAPARPASTAIPAAADEPPTTTGALLTPGRRRLALFALALGGFGIGASEFVSMGLLPGIAHGLLPDLMAVDPERGIARAGQAISAYALGVVVGAPTLALLGVKMSRTRLIVLLALILAVATAVSALMPTFGLTVLARFLAGVPHGAYFGVASLIAASLMGPGSAGKGVALALSGLTIANLLGVPLFTALGQAQGWRVVYLCIAAIFALTMALLMLSLPKRPAPVGRSVADELRVLRRVQLWALVAIVSVGFAGSFTIFSYIADITEGVAGASASFVPWVLAAAGLGMTIGNIVGGISADRSLFGTIVVGYALYIVAILVLNLTMATPMGLLLAFGIMNFFHASLNPPMQGWLMKISGSSEVLGASMHHAAFNIANAIGAFAGGAVIAAGFGLRAPAALGLILATTGFAMTIIVLLTLRARAEARARRAGAGAAG